MKHCRNCGAGIDDDADICTHCGVNQATRLEGGYRDRGANERYCPSCGELLNKHAELCPECGVRQPDPSSNTASSDQVAAGVLAVLLGGLGAHKFYQGNVKLGVLYLCLSWTLIPAIVGLVEGILILIADADEYERTYADGSFMGR